MGVLFGLAAIGGHMFSFWVGFKGGKGNGHRCRCTLGSGSYCRSNRLHTVVLRNYRQRICVTRIYSSSDGHAPHHRAHSPPRGSGARLVVEWVGRVHCLEASYERQTSNPRVKRTVSVGRQGTRIDRASHRILRSMLTLPATSYE